MNYVFTLAIALITFLFSVNTLSHQFLPTNAKLVLTSDHKVKLTSELDMIEMIQQAMELGKPTDFIPGMRYSMDEGALIEQVRQLSEVELSRALKLIEQTMVTRIEIQVNDQRIPLTSRPLPSAAYMKEFLSQPPEFTQYRLPLFSHGKLPNGSKKIRVKFPSQFGSVKLRLPDSPSMLVYPGSFSFPITVNDGEDISSQKDELDNSETNKESLKSSAVPAEGPQNTDPLAQSATPETSESGTAESSSNATVPLVVVKEISHPQAQATSLHKVEAPSVKNEEPSASGDSQANNNHEEVQSEPKVSISVTPTVFEQISTYLYQGVLHIVPKGLDHILFVLALFLLSTQFKPLLWQVTVFTLAHTITLLLAGYQVIQAPASVVEPLIALSIAFVALENMFHSQLKSWRLLIIFAFGLLHGLGFASVLLDLGLPQQWAFLSLVSFNIGVEFGQLLVVTTAFLLVGWFRHASWYRKVIILPGSALIAAVGLFWTFERVMG